MKHAFLIMSGLLIGGMLLGASPAGAQADGQGPRGEKKARPQGGGDGRRRDREAMELPPEVEALRHLSALPGRPTDRAVTLNLLADKPLEAWVEFGTAPGRYKARTSPVSLPPGKPVEVTLDNLKPDTAYVYRLQSRQPGAAVVTAGAEQGFHTQRAPGSSFRFEIQGDSHPERPQQFDPALYARTLQAAAADRPDFYLTIGDDFSVDTLRTVTPTPEAVHAIYLNQRLFLGLIGRAAPVFLVNGNHEQAAKCNLDGTAMSVAVLAQVDRNRYFPQPAPDNFYTGDAKPVEFIGPLRDYYAWTWGDALFVVIDPYWHADNPVDNPLGGGPKARDNKGGGRDPWTATLGDDQYQWLKKTLESSRAKYKFVFAHHVLGTGRGGIEDASLFEWGGQNRRGENEFKQRRPGWELPVHQLMAKNGVTIFFQGHDHIFVRQELDGVVYQTLPEPADPTYTLYNREAYRTGDALPNSGRVRVTVSPAKTTVEYLRSRLPQDATPEHPDGEVAFRYDIPAKH